MRKKILIVITTYYPDISVDLLNSAQSKLKNFAKIKVLQVPGVFEIPVTISKNIKKFDGFLALGCVIRGETPHFEFISKSTTDALMKLSIENKKPIGNGVITCLNKKQARARSKKGKEAADAVISVLSQ